MFWAVFLAVSASFFLYTDTPICHNSGRHYGHCKMSLEILEWEGLVAIIIITTPATTSAATTSFSLEGLLYLCN